MRVKAGGSRQKTIARRALTILLETKHHTTVFGSIVAYNGRFVDRRHAGLACSAGHSRAVSGVLAYRSPVLSTLGISTPRGIRQRDLVILFLHQDVRDFSSKPTAS
ncbi:MAG: hypothetical protein ACXVBG_14345, partial [Isosphaeraceae bacterium]